MGSEEFYPEERPVHEVAVDGFWIDELQVTVADFRRFVKATDYVTLAERPLDPTEYPEADPAALVPGSLVFHRTPGPVPLDDYRNWWSYVPGASWRHPKGPEARSTASIATRSRTSPSRTSRLSRRGPAKNSQRRRSGNTRPGWLEGKTFTWGDEFAPRGRMMANTWQGEFPWQNTLEDRFEGTSPVGSFPQTA